MLRVLLLITKGDIGGAQVSVSLLAKQLQKRGYEVAIGVGQEGSFLREKLADASIPLYTFTHLRRSTHLLRNIMFIREFKHFLSQHHFDVIHLNSSNTLFAAVATKWFDPRLKTIFTHRGLSLIDPLYTPSPLKRKINTLFLRTLLRYVDAQVYVSKRNQEQTYHGGIQSAVGTVIYNGLDPHQLSFLEKNKARAALGERVGRDISHQLVIGSIGRLAYQKNYEFLIRSFPALLSRFPSLICVIIGDGPEHAKLRQRVEKHHLTEHLFLVGAISNAVSYIPGFDLFVLPSRYEGLSITLIEALFAGVPIVASDVGGNQEVIGDAGIIFPLDEETQFVDNVADLLADPAHRLHLSKKAYNRSGNFVIDKTVDQYISLYENLSASRPDRLTQK